MPNLIDSRMEMFNRDGDVVGWVEFYDDYSIEWEFNGEGRKYPQVRKTLFLLEKNAPETIDTIEYTDPEPDSDENLSATIGHAPVDESPERFKSRATQEFIEQAYVGLR